MDAYAPFPITADAESVGLTRTVVDTPHGPTVVHARMVPGTVAWVGLHGVAGSWSTWTPVLAAADALGAADASVVLLDLPGWGGSPTPVEPLTLDQATEVVVAVTAHLGVERFAAIGHSMGAFVMLHVAVVLPDAVARVVVVSATTFAVVDAARHPLRALVTLPAFTLLRAGFAVVPHAATTLLRALARIGLLPLLSAPVFRHVRRLDPSVTRTFVDEIRPVAFLGAARAAASYDVRRWGAIGCPVLAVGGAGDVFARRDDLSRLRALVPQARTVLLPDAGHFANVERPFEVVRAICGG